MELFTISGISTLGMLVLLQAVLGFDNLLYISIESKRAPEDRQQFVRRLGIGLAILLRVVLLYVVVTLIKHVGAPLFGVDWPGVVAGQFTLQSIITLVGGVFILYAAVKEIMHMLVVEEVAHDRDSRRQKSVGAVIFWIVLMNLVFSFDSILSAMALTDSFWIMAVAILVSGALMVWLADYVADFLKKNRMYEVLGLFILFIVGVMLLGEGGHLAHLTFFGHRVEPMEKTTFYFTIAVLVAIDIVQGRYRKKLLAQRQHELHGVG
ncbi:MAG: tellurium resistance protein TerC [Pirellulales bacterium]|nr:tellurium resistance protein TerC [Pirellulales bacterium]